MDEQKSFSVDLETISPEEVIASITQEGVEEVLGSHKNILYIGIREVKAYVIEEWQVFMWQDQRGRENTLFIGGPSSEGNNDQIYWYRDRGLAGQGIQKVPNKRDFVEQCVLWKNITPENLSQ